jgi:hypothetical protein
VRIRTWAAIGAVGLALAGCGGGGSSSSSGGTRSSSGGSTSSGKTSDPVAAVRATLREFANDLLGGNYSGACDLFTTSARGQVGGSGCANLLAQAMKTSKSKSDVQKALPKIDTWPVAVHGNTATTPNVNGGSQTTFVKQGGRWLIGAGGSSG